MNRFEILVSRRKFLRRTALAAGLCVLPDWVLEENRALASQRKPLSPNDRPGIGLIGCGGQGRGDCRWARNFGDVIAVSDLDSSHLAQAARQFNAPHQYHDFRKLLERDDIHIIINGTPDHWHTLVNIAACRAGKDIYAEKPLTLTIAEGKLLVESVRKHRRILQVGSQQRSDARFRLACELVRNGRIGKLQHMLVGLPTGPREGPFPPVPVPQELDWDTYLGQTPKVEYNGHNAHRVFRWWYQFSGGQMTDWGAHHNDIAQWGNGTELSGPVEFDGKGFVDMTPGGYETMAEYEVKCLYKNGVRMTITNRADNGVRFEGSEGWIYVSREQIKASRQELIDEPLPAGAVRLYKSDNHMGNFFECIRSRKDPICKVEIGHRSISVAHLGVLSVRLKRRIRWDPETQHILGDSEASKWLHREMREPYDLSYIA